MHKLLDLQILREDPALAFGQSFVEDVLESFAPPGGLLLVVFAFPQEPFLTFGPFRHSFSFR